MCEHRPAHTDTRTDYVCIIPLTSQITYTHFYLHTWASAHLHARTHVHTHIHAHPPAQKGRPLHCRWFVKERTFASTHRKRHNINAALQGNTHVTLSRTHSVHQPSPKNTYRHSDVELSVRICHGDAGRRLRPSVASHVDKVPWHLDGLKHDIVVRQKVNFELTEDVPSSLHTSQGAQVGCYVRTDSRHAASSPELLTHLRSYSLSPHS